ncbi:MAG: valine--pyruvate transaminase [Sphaerochaetaceae bacterium]|jgi:valine--pyruvate aminotransferase
MKLSDFGSKLTARSGILRLMDDLGKPLPEGIVPYPLGGGNPARIPQVEAAYRHEMEKLLSHGEDFENAIAHYDAPQGRMRFVEQVSSYLSRTYGWKIGPENVAVLNGSQSAMFDLFNMFSGTFTKGSLIWRKTILFPLMPEYVGYADQGIERDTFASLPSRCEYIGDHTFKYFIDFPLLEKYLDEHGKEGKDGQVGAICVTRPTNPSGNVLTDEEIRRLSRLAHECGIPLIVDNAYGLPFPDIVFVDHAEPIWNEDIVLSMSLSKIGLPAIRTGIVIASKEIVAALSNINAIVALTSGSMGQVLAGDLIESGVLVKLARNAVQPYYQRRAVQTQKWINTFFEGTSYAFHKMEGSIFCWLYLPDLRIGTCRFYEVLKGRGVITVPGEYSFFGHPDQRDGKPYPHPHYDKCLRLNYSAPEAQVETGLRIIAEEYRNYGG